MEVLKLRNHINLSSFIGILLLTQSFQLGLAQTLPVVTVAATDASAGEPGTGQGTGTFTFSRTGPVTAALTVNYTVSGTATSGTDYTALGTAATFAANSATAVATVSVIDDVLVEGNETVVMTLAAGSSYTIGLPSSATVTIQDDECVPATVNANVNITKKAGNHVEECIAINPTNPNNLFSSTTFGASTKFSMDGGLTWLNSNVGALLVDGGDDSATWDNFGNLFLTQLGVSQRVVVGLSTNGGATFSLLFQTTTTGNDQPSIAAGPGGTAALGSVWITYTDSANRVVAHGAAVNGLGVVGAFGAAQIVPGANGGFGDISIGPNGQVTVAYQRTSGIGPDSIKVHLDPDGLGAAGFNQVIIATSTQVGGLSPIPAQLNRTIDAEAGLAWDRSTGPHNGRLYLVYTDRSSTASADTDIFVRFSDDNGTTWSAPVRVNDDPAGNGKSQFLPRIALDQTTGHIAVSYYDCRNSVNNNTVEFWASVSTDGGLSFAPNVKVSAGVSDASLAADGGFDFGDYTGLAFHGGKFYPCWADNSNSTGDNPDGTLHGFDVYTAKVTVVPCSTTTVTVVATDVTAGEPGAGQGTGTFTLSRTGPTTAALTVNFTVGGTAASGADYTALGTTATFAANSATAVATVNVINDVLVEGDETVVLTLAAGSGYTVGSPSTATVTIKDDDTSGSSLVGYWKLDDAGGLLAADSSGNGNTGTLINGPGWTSGRFGGGLSLDGVDDYVRISNSPSLNPGSQITLSAWIRPSNVSVSGEIISKENNAQDQYYLRLQVGGKVRMAVAGVVVTGATTLSVNTWYLVTGTYDGANLRVYVNGILDGTLPSNLTMLDNGLDVRLGVREFSNALPFPGLLDEARIYNRALTPTEVQSLLDPFPTPHTLMIDSVNPNSGVTVTVSPADNNGLGTGTTSFTRTYNDGALVNLSAPPLAGGNNFQKWRRDGVDWAVTPATTVTMDAGHTLSAIYAANVSPAVTLTAPPNGATFTAGANIPISATAIDSDGTINKVDFYAGATLLGTATVGVGNVYTITWNNVASNAYVLTAVATDNQNASTTSAPINITVNPASDPSLVGYWKLDDGNGLSALDSSGNGNTGTLVNGPVWTVGSSSGALSFDGVDDYVDLGNSAILNPATAITLVAWAKANSTAVTDELIAKSDASSIQYELRIQAGGKLRVTFEAAVLTGGTTIGVGSWHQVAATYDGATIKLYVDGVLDGTLAATGTMSDNGVNARLGGRAFTTPLTLNGALDSARIYNRALSQAEIQALTP